MNSRCRKWLVVMALLVSMVTPRSAFAADELTVIGFNVESGDADPAVLADAVAGVQGCDIWGFSEVNDTAWAETFESAAEDGENANFTGILGTTGGEDRLLIVYDSDRLEEVGHEEVAESNTGGTGRAALVAHFRLRSTGQAFLFMVNHLYRSGADHRHEQARVLNAWAQEQTLPVIAVGTYNFDWNVENGEVDHDEGYDLLITDEVFTWVQPTTLSPTQCHRDVQRVLDFVFVSGDAQAWPGTSEILFPQSAYCPDDSTTSDHRPVQAVFELTRIERTPPLKEQLLEQIERIESELSTLKGLVEGLP